LKIQPAQVTLVPDAQLQLTSDHGWDTIGQQALLASLIVPFKKWELQNITCISSFLG
jgi:pyridoxine 5-phosphate synthase